MRPILRYWLDNMGDHTIAAWVCAGTHLVAGGCATIAAVKSAPRTVERKVWASVAILLLALGINKQLDLQILAIALSREALSHTSLWSVSRPLGAVVLGLLGMAVVGTLIAHRKAVYLRGLSVASAAWAAVAVCVLVLAHGTSGSVNDLLMKTVYQPGGDFLRVELKDVSELFTALVVGISALCWLRREPDRVLTT